MGRSGGAARLTRERIVAAATEQLERSGVDGVSTRTIGEALGVHPTALYRHFRDMDELLREAADGILAGVVGDGSADVPGATRAGADPLEEAAQLCRRIRAVLLDHPGAARVMSGGPSRMVNERAVTERLLALLAAAGLPDEEVVGAYHALVEYTVGSAALDSIEAAGDPDEVEERHRAWRSEYLAAPPGRFPATARYAAGLYPSLETQFEYGLDLLLCALRGRAG